MAITTLIKVTGDLNPDAVTGIDLPYAEGLVGWYEAETSVPVTLRNWADRNKPMTAYGSPSVDATNGGAQVDAVNGFDTMQPDIANFTVMIIAKIPQLVDSNTPNANMYGSNVQGSVGTSFYTNFRTGPDRTIVNLLASGFDTLTMNVSNYEQYHCFAWSVDATQRIGLRDWSFGSGVGAWSSPTGTRSLGSVTERIGGRRTTFTNQSSWLRAAKWNVAHDDTKMLANARRMVSALKARHPNAPVQVI